MKQEDVTIIVPHLGASKEQVYSLEQCVQSLLETCQCTIIVAKNGPSSGLRPQLPEVDRLKLVWISDQGQCKAVNSAVGITNTPWILVTNDDMVYPPGWFERLTEPLQSENAFGCVSPKLIEPIKGAPTFEQFFCGGAGGDFDKQKFLDFAEEYYKRDLGTGYRTGFNLPFLIHRELWDTIGGYDINYDPWGSNGDSDMEYKIKLAGIQSMQNYKAIVYHFSQTSGTSHPDNRNWWEKNWHYFIDKWGFERASSPTIWEASFEIPQDLLTYKPEWMNKYVH